MKRFIDVSEVDRRYFADESGKTWIPVGCDICFFRDSERSSEETVWSAYQEWLTSFQPILNRSVLI